MCDTGLPGLCAMGVHRCIDGVGPLRRRADPQPEVCNASDDDCDGQIDEDGACDPCLRRRSRRGRRRHLDGVRQLPYERRQPRPGGRRRRRRRRRLRQLPGRRQPRTRPTPTATRSATSATTAASSPTPIRPTRDADGVGDLCDGCPDLAGGDDRRRRRRRRARCLRQLRRRGQRRPGERRWRRFRRRLRPLPPQPAGHGDGDGDGLGDICDPCPRDPATRPTGWRWPRRCLRQLPRPSPTRTRSDSDGDGDGDLCCPGFGQPDLCDGGDSDCDGAVDEDAPSAQACGTGLRGSCAVGVIVCVERPRGVRPDRRPAARGVRRPRRRLRRRRRRRPAQRLRLRRGAPRETCNGLDDDCDGVESTTAPPAPVRRSARTASAVNLPEQRVRRRQLLRRGRVHRPLRRASSATSARPAIRRAASAGSVRRARLQRRAHLLTAAAAWRTTAA
jgi:hypothetical protein